MKFFAREAIPSPLLLARFRLGYLMRARGENEASARARERREGGPVLHLERNK
jgi:hypothetical protein